MKIVADFILGLLAIVIGVFGYFLFGLGQNWQYHGLKYANALMYKYGGIAAMAVGVLLLLTAIYMRIKK